MQRSTFGHNGVYQPKTRFERFGCKQCKAKFEGPFARRIAEAHVRKAHG